jgi:HD-GYP domain-containing protein (c-di-GMP phosphodiesterase class II)
MRLITTSRIPEGAVLGRDILSGRPDGLPLLRSGQKLTAAYVQRLQAAGINAVYIEDAASEGIVPQALISPEARSKATRAVTQAYRTAAQTVQLGNTLSTTAVKPLADVVDLILSEVCACDGAMVAVVDLAGADAYTFQHSIDVTALGVMIGNRLFRERGWVDYKGRRQFAQIEERLFLLGMGLLLHDIGKLAIPLEVLKKPGRLTEEEWQLVRTHPRAGLELLNSDEWSPLVRNIVLRHHERWDGSGYPDGKSGEEIHEMARIASVADVYDAVTSARPYSTARPPCEGVRVIQQGTGSQFDPGVVDVFTRLVPPFPVGSEVTLADGRSGLVASIPPVELDRPVVRLLDGGGEVALLEDPSLQIQGWPLREREVVRAA